MTEAELQAIEERWAKVSPIFKDDVDTLIAEARRLNELLEMRCTNCHLRKESEVARK